MILKKALSMPFSTVISTTNGKTDCLTTTELQWLQPRSGGTALRELGNQPLYTRSSNGFEKFYGEDAVIVYFYCSYEKQGVQSARNSIACMLRTALSQLEKLPGFVLEAWKRHDHGSNTLSLLALRELLCKLLTNRRKSFILVDALDEITCSLSKNERQLEPDAILDEVNVIVAQVNKLKADLGQICCRALFTYREKCPDRFSRAEVAEMLIEAAEEDVQITVTALIQRGFFKGLGRKIKKVKTVQARIVDKVQRVLMEYFFLPDSRWSIFGNVQIYETLRTLSRAYPKTFTIAIKDPWSAFGTNYAHGEKQH